MSEKVIGKIIVIKDTVQVTEKFAKRELVVQTTTDMYPQMILMQFAQDKCSVLDGYSEGENVEVSFNLQGRSWENPQGEIKYFNTLSGWRIERVDGAGETNEEKIPQSDATQFEEDEDDLPF